MKTKINQILFVVLSLAVNAVYAAEGIYAELDFEGESGSLQANGNGELMISQKDGTQNGIWQIGGKSYVGFKQPDNNWTVFDPSGMGAGFTPPPEPEMKVTIEKTSTEVTVANITGIRYNVTSEENGKVEKSYMIASKNRLVRDFNDKFFNLMKAAQESARGKGPSSGFDDMQAELKKRGLGVLEFGDDKGISTFKVTLLDRRNIDVKLPAEPGDPFANIGGPGKGLGDLGIKGTGPDGQPTEADIEKMQQEMMEKFKQFEQDQVEAQAKAEKEWQEKEARKKAEREANKESAVSSSSMAASESASASDSAANVGDTQAPQNGKNAEEKDDLGKAIDSVKDLFKGLGGG